jgi:hypothetical protein
LKAIEAWDIERSAAGLRAGGQGGGGEKNQGLAPGHV